VALLGSTSGGGPAGGAHGLLVVVVVVCVCVCVCVCVWRECVAGVRGWSVRLECVAGVCSWDVLLVERVAGGVCCWWSVWSVRQECVVEYVAGVCC
jgi:hypothetical protein